MFPSRHVQKRNLYVRELLPIIRVFLEVEFLAFTTVTLQPKTFLIPMRITRQLWFPPALQYRCFAVLTEKCRLTQRSTTDELLRNITLQWDVKTGNYELWANLHTCLIRKCVVTIVLVCVSLSLSLYLFLKENKLDRLSHFPVSFN
jgi:hypothetical protein